VAPQALLSMCERAQIPMFATQGSSAFVIDILRAYLSKHFADRITMHGVFMDILGLGVLITGESGLGKSELGLELISRGNGLVADDAVDLFRINQDTIEGRCPELLMNLLEVRGIGLLDIRAIFGETAVRRRMRLKLIVHLVRRETLEREYERIPYEPLTQDVLEVPVRKVVIQVVAGRNIAVLVEAAVRNTLLQFIDRLAALKMAAAQNICLFKLGQHPVHGGQPHIGAILQQDPKHIFGRHVPLGAFLENFQDLQPGQSGLQPRVFQFVDIGHLGLSLAIGQTAAKGTVGTIHRSYCHSTSHV
jgi:Hpr(Ser) kinase/phosphatase